MTKEDEAKQLLEKYTDTVLKALDLDTKKKNLRARIITPEIQEQLDALDAEFAPYEKAITDEQAFYAAGLKKAVLEAKTTIKGTTHMVVFTKGREAWNTDMLEGMAAALPQIMQAYKVGSPSISIRVIK